MRPKVPTNKFVGKNAPYNLVPLPAYMDETYNKISMKVNELGEFDKAHLLLTLFRDTQVKRFYQGIVEDLLKTTVKVSRRTGYPTSNGHDTPLGGWDGFVGFLESVYDETGLALVEYMEDYYGDNFNEY